MLIFHLLFSLTALASPMNPAASVLKQETEFSFGTQTIGARFDGVENAPSSSTTLWSIGFNHPFSLNRIWDRRAGLELSLSGPYGSLRSLRAYEAKDLYPLRYGHTDSQFQANAGLGVELVPKTFYFGAGIQFFLSGAGNSEATLSTTNPTGRLALDVGLNSAAYSGVFYKQERFSSSLLYRQEMNPEFVQKFDAKAPIGGENTFHQPLTARSHLYFEPHTFELESTYDSGPAKFQLGVSYQLWDRYQHPVVIAETVDSQGKISSTTPPDTQMRNTWSPHAGVGVSLEERLTLNARYTYRPTAVVNLSGIGNPLDSDTHIISLSLGQSLDFLVWKVFAEHHFFESRTVAKKADSSSYTFGGSAYSIGATLGFPL